jgi:EAL domain-containing protein (putative c-di-GMP-specific phosphodiesterase class I)
VPSFPVDVLKIDKSFVDALTSNDGEQSSLVGAIVNLGMMLGLHVTAEGIEGAAQLASLRSMGCELGQGFLFAKPMDAETLLETVLTNGASTSLGQDAGVTSM